MQVVSQSHPSRFLAAESATKALFLRGNFRPVKALCHSLLLLLALSFFGQGSAYAFGKHPIGDTRELTTQPVSVEATDSSLFRFTPDANFLVYTDSNKELKSYDVGTHIIHPISENSSDSPDDKLIFFSLSSDGKQVIYSKGLRKVDNAKLVLANIDGSNRVLITSKLKDTQFTPRKTLVAGHVLYLERREESPTYRLMRYDIDAHTAEEIKPDGAGIWDVLYFNISSDGSALAFVGRNAQGDQQLFYTKFGNATRAITAARPDIVPGVLGKESSYSYDQGESLRFSADGQTLFFVASQKTDSTTVAPLCLYAYSFRSGFLTILSQPEDAVGIHEYVVSETFQRVIYATGVRANALEAWSVRFDGQQRVRLHDRVQDGAAGVQSGSLLLNDGSATVYFHAALQTGSGQLGIYRVRPDGQKSKSVAVHVPGLDNLGIPLWSSHKDFVVFSAMPTDFSRTDLFAIGLSDDKATQLNRANNAARLGLFKSTERNHVIYSATETRAKLDLFLANTDAGARTKLNHSLQDDEEVSGFAIDDSESLTAYVVRKGSDATLWIRSLKKSSSPDRIGLPPETVSAPPNALP